MLTEVPRSRSSHHSRTVASSTVLESCSGTDNATFATSISMKRLSLNLLQKREVPYFMLKTQTTITLTSLSLTHSATWWDCMIAVMLSISSALSAIFNNRFSKLGPHSQLSRRSSRHQMLPNKWWTSKDAHGATQKSSKLISKKSVKSKAEEESTQTEVKLVPPSVWARLLKRKMTIQVETWFHLVKLKTRDIQRNKERNFWISAETKEMPQLFDKLELFRSKGWITLTETLQMRQ